MSQDTTRKRRPDAVLHQLPEERKMEIFERLDKDGIVKTRAWLREDGLVIGSTALADFWHSWAAELRLRQAEVQRLAVIERMAAERPDVSLEQVEEFADAMFLMKATAEGDAKAFTGIRKITEGAKRTKLESRRITILERKAAQADKAEAALKDQSLTMEERQAKLREVFGIT
jgi:hypothetical protein